LDVANTLNKPIVLSEFGFPRDQESLSPDEGTTYRNQFYEAVFSQIQRSHVSNGVFAGCNFWGYAGSGVSANNPSGRWQSGDDFLADPPQEPQGLNSVFSLDTSTLQRVKHYNFKLH
jgi:mannan endo-1,4-beta-mannosidase